MTGNSKTSALRAARSTTSPRTAPSIREESDPPFDDFRKIQRSTMSQQNLQITSRRRLLQFLAASPLFARNALAEGLRPSDPADWAPRDLDKLIADPTQALDVFDFEPVMKKNVPPAHFGYMATGVDDVDETTLRAKRDGFRTF